MTLSLITLFSALSLEPSAETSKSTESAESTVKSSTKKLVTQGQADHLNLSQLKEHTTLAFEIEKRKKKKKHANKSKLTYNSYHMIKVLGSLDCYEAHASL